MFHSEETGSTAPATPGPQTTPASSAPQPTTGTPTDTAHMDLLVQRARDEQNLVVAVLAGAGAALVGAVLWALITAFTGFQIGFMALGVGFLVGWTVRKMGRGVDPVFGVIGAGFALFGCIVGNVLSAAIMLSRQEGIPFGQVMAEMNPALAGVLLISMFSLVDLVFYGIAVYEGWQFSFRKIQPPEETGVTQQAA